ncbi:hypothetical protein [Helicobacter sp. MIT 05-5294]|uniref:hypothetical protein n=1 Tax=Helicobacter sp. MIT 05-5294 TaxID=1548150 RepID=UPI001EE7F600|nr:hypothetical protein [Helicobacter sp. MIT 05-5294]
MSNKIVEVYFSYGEEQIRLQEYSRHSEDVNSHIVTRDCRDNEEIEITLESSNHQRFTTCAKIHNNKAVIKNVFKSKYIAVGEVKVYVR